MAFTAVPPGFFAANEVLNTLAEPIVSTLIDETVDVQFSKSGVLSASKYLKLIASSAGDAKSDGALLSEEVMQSAIHAVAFVIRAGASDKLSVDAFTQAVNKKTDLNPARRALFVAAWKAHTKDGVLVSSPTTKTATAATTAAAAAAAPSTGVASALKLGQLVGFDWKLGVAVSSSHCRALQSPFVSIVLRIAEPNGAVSSHALELTLRQFQEFSKTFHDVAQQLETV